MPRRQILADLERNSLLALPESQYELIQLYTLSEHDLSIISQQRGAFNRLGFAIQLCYMRYPGIILPVNQIPNVSLLKLVCNQLNTITDAWDDYSERAETRREHLIIIQSIFGFLPFAMNYYQSAVRTLETTAFQTDKGIVLANELIEYLRKKKILLPSVNVIERICAQAITQAERLIYRSLTESLSDKQKEQLDVLLLLRDNCKITTLVWLRQSPAAPNAKHLLEHIERLNTMEALQLPVNLEKQVHQNRLLKLAREGGQMTPQHLDDLETTRRHATLVAIILEAKATVIDQIVDLHDRIVSTLFSRAKNLHQQQFQRSGKEINNKVMLYWCIGNALLAAKQTGEYSFVTIESMISWDEFTQSIGEAARLAQSESFDYIHLVGDSYSQIRRYATALLEALQLKAAPAAKEIMEAVDILKDMNTYNGRKLPPNTPTGFVRKRWENLIFKKDGLDRRFYELCVFSELKNALRSGDIWVQGSRQFKDFEEYLLPADKFAILKEESKIPLTINTDPNEYLKQRMALLHQQ